MAKKIVVVNSYKAFPPIHGGHIAMNGLYGNLARWLDVEIVDFVDVNLMEKKRLISSNFTQNSLYKDDIFDEEQNFVSHEMYYSDDASKTFGDTSIFCDRNYKDVQRFVDEIKHVSEDAELVIAEHPYTYKLIKKACPDKRIWYRAQNVEYDYKISTYSNLSEKDRLVKEVFDIEKECCEGSSLILTITESDKSRLVSLYGVSPEKILTISAGYDLVESNFMLPSTRSKSSTLYDAQAFFLSSYAEPAVDAAKYIIDLAKKIPNVMFIIAGSIQRGLVDIELTDNVIVEGIISNKLKSEYLHTSDFALNPIEGGSGLNIKMLEYFSYGLPVITSEFGARGLNIKDKEDVLIANTNNLVAVIEEFIKYSTCEKDRLTKNAYNTLINHYSWRSVAIKIIDYIRENSIFNIEDIERPVESDFDPAYDYLDKRIIERLCMKSCYIWGTGPNGTACLNLLKNYNINVKGFIDNDKSKTGKTLLGQTVSSPDVYFDGNRGDYIIIASRFFHEIYPQILNKGLDRSQIFIFLEGEFLFHDSLSIASNESSQSV